jgi:RNA polymerase-binding transcription factor DksA
MTYGSQAAAASQVFAQQRDLALREAAERRVREVDAALARIDAGTFGRCTACGEPIAEARLDALPWAALCIDCQRRTVSR